MSFSVEINNRSVPIQVVRHKRAKYVRLSVRDQQRVRLTLPMRATLKEARQFVERMTPWIVQKLSLSPEIVPLTDGVTIPIFGKAHTLRVVFSDAESVQLQGDGMHVAGAPDRVYALVHQFMQSRLEHFCSENSQAYAKQLGVKIHTMTVKNVRARWGSCSTSRHLVFAWRLACVPEDVVRYVCAHEVAHLKEMNHSPAFWALVAKLYPHYKEARAWLRKNGKNVWLYKP